MSESPSLVVAAGATSARRWPVRPVMAVKIAILVLLVGQLGRIPVLSTGTSEAPLLVNDICLLAVILIAAVSSVNAGSFRIDSVGGLMLAFATVGFLSATAAVPRFGLTGMQLVISLAYLARWLVYFGLYLVIINLARGRDVLTLWRALETMMLLFAVFGIFQSIFLPHFAQIVYPESRLYTDWDEQGHRLVSTVLEPNIAGSMIVLVLLVELAQLSAGEQVPTWKPLVLFGAMIATLSRSSLLGLAVGGVIVLAVRGISRRMLRVAGVVFVLFLAASPQIIAWARQFKKLGISDSSALSRVVDWLRALRIFADHPIFGIGFNTFGFVAERYGVVRSGASTFGTDGGLLFIAVMTGVVGLALYVAMLTVIIRRCRQIWRSPHTPELWRGLATGIAAATVAVCVQGAFVNSLLTPFPMEMLWVLWSLTFVMKRETQFTPRAQPTTRVVAVARVA